MRCCEEKGPTGRAGYCTESRDGGWGVCRYEGNPVISDGLEAECVRACVLLFPYVTCVLIYPPVPPLNVSVDCLGEFAGCLDFLRYVSYEFFSGERKHA